MKLLIGLGNPGSKYIHNRHNAGYLFIDSIATLQNDKVFKTDTFMNDSGRFVKSAMSNKQCAINDLYIIHDDLDIPLGQYKIQLGVGPKVHNGVNNIEEVLGTKDFWRIRIGVDNREPQNRILGEDYVLQNFNNDELISLNKVFDAIVKDSAFPS